MNFLKLFLIFFFFLYPTDVFAENTFENNLDKYKFHAFLIYPHKEYMPKLVYENTRFGDIRDIKREIIEFQTILSQGEYIEDSDFFYNAYQFHLESITTGIRQEFYFDLEKGKTYYLLIDFDKDKLQINSISPSKGRSLLKKLKKTPEQNALIKINTVN